MPAGSGRATATVLTFTLTKTTRGLSHSLFTSVRLKIQKEKYTVGRLFWEPGHPLGELQ